MKDIIMKASYFFSLTLIIAISMSVDAQVMKKAYRVRIELSESSIVKGHLKALNDSGIELRMHGRGKIDTVILISHIRSIALRRRYAPVKGFFIGLGVGTLVGAGIGYGTYSPANCGNNLICLLEFERELRALTVGFAGSVAGSFSGLAIGFSYKAFRINGDIRKYHVVRNQILNGRKAGRARTD